MREPTKKLLANAATTKQAASQTQTSSSSCLFGCGGSSQAQFNTQNADTNQAASSEKANATPNGVNANLLVSNSATSAAANAGTTKQAVDQAQDKHVWVRQRFWRLGPGSAQRPERRHQPGGQLGEGERDPERRERQRAGVDRRIRRLNWLGQGAG